MRSSDVRVVIVLCVILSVHATVSLGGLPKVDTTELDAMDRANRRPGPGSIPVGAGIRIDLLTGNLHVSRSSSSVIPIEHGALALGHSYNSNLVRLEEVHTTATPDPIQEYLVGRGWMGLGWKSHLGRLYYHPKFDDSLEQYESVGERFYEYPNGARTATYQARQSPGANLVVLPRTTPCNVLPQECDPLPSGMTLQECMEVYGDQCPDGYDVTFPDGSVGEFTYEVIRNSRTGDNGWDNNWDTAGWYLEKLIDPEGNTVLHVEYAGPSSAYPEAITRIYSEVDNTLDIDLDLCVGADVPSRCPEVGLLKTVTSLGFKGGRSAMQNVVYEFHYSTVSVTDDAGTHTEPVLTEVKLPSPDGVAPSAGSYKYFYDTDLSLESGTAIHGPVMTAIELPTGAEFEFKYDSWSSGSKLDGSDTVDRTLVGVTKVVTFPDGVASPASSSSRFETAWSREFTLDDCDDVTQPSSGLTNSYVTTAPDGRQSSVSYFGHPCASDDPAVDDWGAIGAVKSTSSSTGTSPLRTTDLTWDYEVESGTDDRLKPIAQKSTSTMSEPAGNWCSTAGTSHTVTSESKNRNDWSQWKTSVLTSSGLLPDDYHVVSHINYYSPDNTSGFPSCSTDDNVVGIYDWSFVEAGTYSGGWVAAESDRVETYADFDCDGNPLSMRTRSEFAPATTVLDSQNGDIFYSANTAPATNDPISESEYTDYGLPSKQRAKIHGTTEYFETSHTYSKGQLLTATQTQPTGAPSYKSVDNTLDASGIVGSSTDPNGLVSAVDYDALGRPITADPPGTAEFSTRIIYPSLTETRTIRSAGSETTFNAADGDQSYSAVFTDGLGRVIEQHRAVAFGTADALSVRRIRYDALGRTVFTSEWIKQSDLTGMATTTWSDGSGYSVGGIPMQDSRPLGTITFYGAPDSGDPLDPLAVTPDELGRVIRVENAVGQVVDYSYCGPHVETTVSGIQTAISGATADSVTRKYYDGLGRLAVVDSPGGVADIAYSYDALGNVTKVNLLTLPTGDPFEAWLDGTLADDQIRTFSYDAAGRLLSMTTPEAGTVTHHKWDALGNVLESTDETGSVRDYFFRNTYDEAGRLEKVERIQGTSTTPITSDVERLDDSGTDRGSFEATDDIGSGAGQWISGTVASDTFSTGSTEWRVVSYGGCLPAPPNTTGNSQGLYLGDSPTTDCTYEDTPATPQALRYSLVGVSRDDVIDFRFWRHVREGDDSKDNFKVVVTDDATDLSDARIVYELTGDNSSYELWRRIQPVRLGDLFRLIGWAEGATKDLYLFFIFEKGDAATSALGTGIIIDDVFVGRRATELMAEYKYDIDNCSGGLAGEACDEYQQATSAYKGKLTEVVSYQGGRMVSRERIVYRGLNGRISGLQTLVDWAGSGETAEFVRNQNYHDDGALKDLFAPYEPVNGVTRQYRHFDRRGFLTEISHVGSREFFREDLSEPSFTYSANGALKTIRGTNGVLQTFARDKMHRLDWIDAIGPTSGGSGTQNIWVKQSYGFDGGGNIISIDEDGTTNDSEFAYDVSGRLTAADLVATHGPEAGTQDASLTYAYDEFGNPTDRSWTGQGSAPEGMVFTNANYSNDNRRIGPGYRYDPSGNQMRITSGSTKLFAHWTPGGQIAQFYLNHPDKPLVAEHALLETYTYDAAGMRLVRYPVGLGSDGQPVITLRDGAGQTVSEFVVSPIDGEPRLSKDFVYGNGRLLVERQVTGFSPDTIRPANTLAGGGNIAITTDGLLTAGSYTVDIRSESGYTKQLTGQTASGYKTLFIPEADLTTDEVNFIRIKSEDSGVHTYSNPISIMIDSTVTSSDKNQVRALAIGRDGTDIHVSFALLNANGKDTDVYFEREDTSQLLRQTATSLPAGTTYTTIADQSMPVHCGEILAEQDSLYRGNTFVPAYDEIAPDIEPDISPCPVLVPTTPTYYFADTFHHRDHLGSLRLATTWAGFEVSGHDYYPYGDEVHSGTIPDGAMERYTGHERDELTGADYMKARYKLASAVSMLSPDPVVGNRGSRSWNRYAYVYSNPTGLVDPTGRFGQGFERAPHPDLTGGGFWGLGGGLDYVPILSHFIIHRFYKGFPSYSDARTLMVESVRTFVTPVFRMVSYNTAPRRLGGPPDVASGMFGPNPQNRYAVSQDVVPCGADGYRDITPEEAAALVNAANEYSGMDFSMVGDGTDGSISCSQLICRAFEGAGLPYEYLWTGAMPGSTSFRSIDPGSSRVGDVVVWPGFERSSGVVQHGHSGIVSGVHPNYGNQVLSATTSQGVRNYAESVLSADLADRGLEPVHLRPRVPCGN